MSTPINSATPETDAHCGSPKASIQPWAEADFARKLERERNAARAYKRVMKQENDRLRQWKKQAMLVLSEWEEAWVAAGSPGVLGQSKAKAMKAHILEISNS